MNETWIAQRMGRIEASGIRKAFELARKLKDPINLSIGLPDFDVPEPVKRAASQAIDEGANQYTLTTGLPELRDKLQARVDAQYGQPDRKVLVTSGTSGGLVLAYCATMNPGDEVIIFDPYFVMYGNLLALTGATPVFIDTYPGFRISLDQVERAITSRTKCVIVNSPGNPTGVVASEAELKGLAQLCRHRDLLLLSDEVYSTFSHDGPFQSPAQWNDETLVVDGFSKSYGMTGWRLGFAHGPSRLIEEMAKLQQFSYVCAPAPLQKGVVAALELDMSATSAAYRRKRDIVAEGLAGYYELARPGGAFYAFPKVPPQYASGTEFARAAIDQNLIVIPGNVFSRQDTHFRLSYAVDDRMLQRGVEVLRKMARA